MAQQMNHANLSLCAFADEASSDRHGQIQALRENGIGLLEIRGVDGTNVAQLPVDKAAQYADELKSSGIGVWSIGSPVGKTKIDGDFDECKRQFDHVLEMARIFGANCIRLFSFYGAVGRPDGLEKVIDRLSALCDMSRGSGVTLCHENEKGIYGDVASRCLEIHRALPEIKAVYDPANFIQCGENTREAYKCLAPYVYYMHIKDCDRDGLVVPPGDGIAGLGDIIRAYAQSSASGVLTLEPHLSEFVGLGGLETDNGKSRIDGLRFPDTRSAFDYAANKLKAIVTDLI